MLKNNVEFSDDLTHRYVLHSKISYGDNKDGPNIVFIMINPSTASAEVDDRTVQKCKKIAAYHRCGNLYLLNLFSYRTKDVNCLDQYLKNCAPDKLKEDEENNDFWIDHILSKKHKFIIAAWGKWDKTEFAKGRAKKLMSRYPVMVCLGKNLDGSPAHPLFKSPTTVLEEYKYVE